VDSFFSWWFQLWPDWLRWFIPVWAAGAAFVGSCSVLFISFMAARYYAFGHKIQNLDTGEFLTRLQTFRLFLLFGGIGAFLLVIGVMLLRWESG
jgi:hypothetical protein